LGPLLTYDSIRTLLSHPRHGIFDEDLTPRAERKPASHFFRLSGDFPRDRVSDNGISDNGIKIY
jgi:hypothetical protein